MPISIIVEDGSNIANANSFVTVAEARQYAAERGVTLSAVDDEVAPLLIKAVDYLESKAKFYQGNPTNADQSLEWPRYGVYVNEIEIASNVIPKQLKSAQCALVIAQHEGVDIMPNFVVQDYVTREKVGPLETEYADPTKVGVMPTLSAVDALLAPLFETYSAGFGLKTVRV